MFPASINGTTLWCYQWLGASVKSLVHIFFPKWVGLAVSEKIAWGQGLSYSCGPSSDHCYLLSSGKHITIQQLCPELEQHYTVDGKHSSKALWQRGAIQQNYTGTKQELENYFCVFFTSTGVESAHNCVLFTDMIRTRWTGPLLKPEQLMQKLGRISHTSTSNSNVKAEPLG